MQSSRNLLLRTLLPVLIGLGVVAWLFAKEFNWSDWQQIPWTGHTLIAIFFAWLAMGGREAGLAWRFRILSGNRLSWKSAIRVTMLCEFTSSITPTSVGGSALSMVFMSKEGIPAGRATTITLTTFLFDEAFFVIMCPMIFLLVGAGSLFGFDMSKVESGIRAAYWIVWGGIVAITILLFLGIIVRPEAIRNVIIKLFNLRYLKKWSARMNVIADDMVAASKELKTKNCGWWCKVSSATVVTWFSRFLVVNALFEAFAPMASQLVVFARQTVVWTLLTISPTPGGSGISEWLFTTYYGDLLADASTALIIAICWRIITYYVYLAAGVFIIPSWLKTSKNNLQNAK